jgi:hypothetical protein
VEQHEEWRDLDAMMDVEESDDRGLYLPQRCHVQSDVFGIDDGRGRSYEREWSASRRSDDQPGEETHTAGVDLDGNAEYFEFWRVVQGRQYPIPQDLYDKTEHVEGRDFIIARAVRAIWQFNKNRRVYSMPKDWQSADEIIAHGLGYPARITLAPRAIRKTYFAMLGLALATARQDTRYWGVEDPNVERYCSGCRKVKPRAQFSTLEWTCETCVPASERRKKRVAA